MHDEWQNNLKHISVLLSLNTLGNPEVTALLACQVFILKICYTCFPIKRNILLWNILNHFALNVFALNVENVNKVCISLSLYIYKKIIYIYICLW